jgi:very-short-patch-repair endonuclease
VDGFILDFYCPTARLCVEVDGGVHDTTEHIDRDAARSEALTERGIRVLRFRNDQILLDLPLVLQRLAQELEAPPNPLPRVGVGGEPQRAG